MTLQRLGIVHLAIQHEPEAPVRGLDKLTVVCEDPWVLPAHANAGMGA
jgi:hypothetical protein